jgi:hypothetical protein
MATAKTIEAAKTIKEVPEKISNGCNPVNNLITGE